MQLALLLYKVVMAVDRPLDMHDVAFAGIDRREGAVQRLSDSLGTDEQKREMSHALYKGMVNQTQVLLDRARGPEERYNILLPIMTTFGASRDNIHKVAALAVAEEVRQLGDLVDKVTMERVKRMRDALSVSIMQLHVRGGHTREGAIQAARLSEVNNVQGALYSCRTVYGCNEKNQMARLETN